MENSAVGIPRIPTLGLLWGPPDGACRQEPVEGDGLVRATTTGELILEWPVDRFRELRDCAVREPHTLLLGALAPGAVHGPGHAGDSEDDGKGGEASGE